MIKQSILEQVLTAALTTGGDFAEIYVEDKLSSGIVLIDGKVDGMNSGRSYGVGIRIFKGLKSVYAYTNDSSLESLLATAKRAATVIGKSGADGKIEDLRLHNYKNIHPITIYPDTVAIAKKIEYLKRIDRAAKAESKEIAQVIAKLQESDKKVLIANSDGLLTEDRRVRTRVFAQAVASNGNENQLGYEAPGRHMGFEIFEQEVDLEAIAKEAAQTAVTMLHAGYAPAGEMTVAIDNGFGGVIFHEACGHSLEATAVSKNNSEFCGKLGQKIASDVVTAIDDGTIANAWGSQNLDDEGMPMQRNLLIENGILKSYMIDKMGGRRMNMAPTGSSRRQDYTFAPTSRMTNTYIAAGESSDEEIIRSIDYGLYAKKMGGGSVNPITGEFNFAVREGYLVEKGEIKQALRGASLIGKGSEIIKKIDMVGKNLAHGTGMCGSLSGSIPVNVGQPMIRVSSMLVGGK